MKSRARGRPAQSIVDATTKQSVIRIDLRGRRPIGEEAALRFAYQASTAGKIAVRLVDTKSGAIWNAGPTDIVANNWATSNLSLKLDPNSTTEKPTGEKPLLADVLEFTAAAGTTLRLDDVLLYEPAQK